MLQRLTKGAHRSQEHNKNSKHHVYDALLDSPNPPVVGKISHHSIELSWEQDPMHRGDKRLKFALEEEDKRTSDFSTVYVGYADSYTIDGLEPLHSYKYRLKVATNDGDFSLSPTITVCTSREPFNSDHLHRATMKADLEAISKILATGDVTVDVNDKIGYTPLMNAAQRGLLEVIELLLEHHADVHAINSSGKNSLIVASYAGHGAVVKRLREAGAQWTCCDKGGSTPLHWAIDGGNCELIQWMIDDGAPVDIKDKTSGWTPLLRCAAITGDPSVAEVLLSSGAEVDCTDIDGKTALMIASLNGYMAFVEKLVENGADVTLMSGHGKTALEMAQSFDRRTVVKYLANEMGPEQKDKQHV
ncbi:fibronectin type 3 and ankyrin repeat domains 1 protein-like [Clavelina lepadiformis]|uniref:fibronectin type 3 and ankyrin repeat domains 1 protein-like n=1 Tax=Clavelina lepadiformis TaxID=159417 RepID=UPI0040415190